jgi:hypothetical protein
MAYFSIGTSPSGAHSERKLQVTEFRGIDQSRGVYNRDPSTSPDAVNFIARQGLLRTAGGTAQYGNDIPTVNESDTPNSKPRLYQAFFRDASGNDISRLIASFNHRLYYLDTATNNWTLIGVMTKDGGDMINYRHETADWAIFTDGNGEAYYWPGSGALQNLAPTQGGVEIKFQQIALLHERLWGGVFKDSPDRVYWSDSFAPEDWEFNYTLTEEGGGFLDVATFDGSRVRAIITAFDDVLIFKDRSVHKLNGTYPGEFMLTQIYGTTGTLSPRSIVSTSDKVFFLASEGLCVYDGMSITSLRNKGDYKLKDTWANLNTVAIEKACAVYLDNVIYLAVCLDATKSGNTHVIEYDTVEQTYNLVELAGVDDFIVLHEGQKKTLLFIAWNKVYRYDSGALFFGNAINASWTSPEIDNGSLASKKQTGYMYLRAEGTSLSVDREPCLKLSVISGGKTRSKIVALKTGVNEVRVRIRIRGRSYRYKIENMNGDPVTVRGGMEISTEEDFD